MFIQVIQGMCTDETMLRQHMDRWREELSPGAQGWLGRHVRHDRRRPVRRRRAVRVPRGGGPQLAAPGAGRVVGGGEPVLRRRRDLPRLRRRDHDARRRLGRRRVRAGHPGSARRPAALPRVHVAADGHAAGRRARRSSAARSPSTRTAGSPRRWPSAARPRPGQGEQMEMPDEMAEQFNREMEQVHDMRYLDLHHPWFASAGGSVTAARERRGPPRAVVGLRDPGGRERTRTSDPHRVKVVR